MMNMQIFKIGALCIVAALLSVFGPKMYGAFTYTETKIQLKIAGQDYGVFDSVDGLTAVNTSPNREEFKKIRLQRSFVSQPSLSLWAKEDFSSQQDIRTIEIFRINTKGDVVKKFDLELSKALSWSLETSETGFDGFKEVVEFSVRQNQKL